MIKNARKDTLFGRANSTLSDMASQISQINQSEAESYEDIRAFGAPSECYTLVSKQYHNLRQTVFIEYQMDEQEFDKLILERTCEKWVHFHSNLV